ncbi:MAG: RNA polymerase sigma factor [Planctomycetaceae bacterium]
MPKVCLGARLLMADAEEPLLRNQRADCFPEEATSLSLVNGLRAGDDGAWERFVRIFGPMVYSMLRNRGIPESEAAELGQQIFIKVHRGIEGFHWNGTNQRIRYWLPPIIRNVVIDAARQRRNELQGIGGSDFRDITQRVIEKRDPLIDLADETFDLEPTDFEIAFRACLTNLKARFKPHVWDCFYERHANDLQSPEIAARLGLNENQVRQAIHRVKAAFVQELSGLVEQN